MDLNYFGFHYYVYLFPMDFFKVQSLAVYENDKLFILFNLVLYFLYFHMAF